MDNEPNQEAVEATKDPLTLAERERLALLAEECAEVIQAVMKTHTQKHP